MSDQEQDLAAEEVTTESTEAPESPEGQEEDKATTEKDQREALYQTKFQELKATHDDLLEKVNASVGQVAQPAQPQQEAAKPNEEEPEMYTPEWQEKHDNELVARMVKATAVQGQQVAQQQEWAEVQKDFTTWTKKNEIPETMVKEAIDEFAKRFANGTPQATVEWVSNYIVKESGKMRKSQATDGLAEDAAKKAEALKTVESPDPGAPTKPAPAEKKTPEDIALDKFGGTTHKASDELFKE